MILPVVFQLAQVVVEAVEAGLPVAAVLLQPVGGVLEGFRPEAAGAPLLLAAAGDEAGAFQDLEVLGDGGETRGEGFGQLGDGGFAAGEAGEDGATGGVGEGGEGGAEGIGEHAG